ncbi:MAG: hypothetical protein WDO68_01045 [Gammaproteobacteria bacterium]
MPENRAGRPSQPPQNFRLNLEQQKNRAKDLLRAVKAGEPQALARIAAQRGQPSSTPIKLADAQFTIARELRLPSWSQLKEHIQRMERQREAIDRNLPAPDADMKTLHLRCGHDLRNILKEAGFVGDFMPHVNPYCRGPLVNTPDYYVKRAEFVFDFHARKEPERGLTLEDLAAELGRAPPRRSALARGHRTREERAAAGLPARRASASSRAARGGERAEPHGTSGTGGYF